MERNKWPSSSNDLTTTNVLICSSLAVVLFRNPVYSAVSLILSFITSGFLWLLLEAEFLAIVLILVYVGAVMVLFLFVIMMLNINEEKEEALSEFRPSFTILMKKKKNHLSILSHLLQSLSD